ncbi:FAD-binding oxidoreductase [Haloarcula sp. S1AR25-5A]|uniref:FAD-binding oxidoreductase n=1 Tax=Haloarcula terrestris TaxID=2950533 RepID=A0AAE4JG77_9EURY|nr:FAD-binding oxidoreductase [Haloarcula terrestris]MDS0221208.1 FAD-binding oxidoreductase [Haloarcula terrestris]
MDLPRHLSQHDRAAQLPLVTEDARVTLVEPMDRNRNNEVLSAVRDQITPVGDRSWLAAARNGSTIQWSALLDRLRDAGASKRRLARIETLAERFDRPYPSLLRLRVKPDVDLDFAPGQYVTLRLRNTPRAYSLANSPSEDELEFCIRLVPDGKLTSRLFERVRVGEAVVVRGPNGDMVLDPPSSRDMVFLATGTGVAPFKSMIDYTFEQGRDVVDGEPRDVWLFLGCGWEDDLPHREHFRQLDAQYDHFHFVPTLTREPLLTDWDGATDYVQSVFVNHVANDALDSADLLERFDAVRDQHPQSGLDARIDPTNVELYACGISAMVSTLVRAAHSVGIPESEMQYEGFG